MDARTSNNRIMQKEVKRAAVFGLRNGVGTPDGVPARSCTTSWTTLLCSECASYVGICQSQSSRVAESGREGRDGSDYALQQARSEPRSMRGRAGRCAKVGHRAAFSQDYRSKLGQAADAAADEKSDRKGLVLTR